MATGCFGQFAGTTSLRGVAKLVRADQHPFLRALWATFLISMFCVLALNSFYLVKEYFEYHVSIQTDQLVNDPSVFPSITVCSHQPFSPRAPSIWLSGQVPSPLNFSRRVKASETNLTRQGRLQDAREVFQNDRVSTYFQNLRPLEAQSLGHSISDLLLLCVMRHSRNTNPSVAHEEACQFRVRRILHPLYFSCYELQVSEDPAYVSSVSMVMSCGTHNTSELSSQTYNLFYEALGLVIILHEPGTYPNIDYEQYNVQPGTASTIRYRPEKYIKYRSPKTDCIEEEELGEAPRISQGGKTEFNYTYEACIGQSISEFIAEHCNCTSAFHLNPRPPTPRHPYCSLLEPEGHETLLARTACARNISLDKVYSEQQDEAASGRQPCRKRCILWRYSVEQSNCDWRPRPEQLTALQRPRLSVTDESELAEAPQSSSLALVTVARATYVTLEHSEKPVITLSALFSRLGGVGSLTLGVTLTFAFELIELTFIQLRRKVASICAGVAGSSGALQAQADGQPETLPLRRSDGSAMA